MERTCIILIFNILPLFFTSWPNFEYNLKHKTILGQCWQDGYTTGKIKRCLKPIEILLGYRPPIHGYHRVKSRLYGFGDSDYGRWKYARFILGMTFFVFTCPAGGLLADFYCVSPWMVCSACWGRPWSGEWMSVGFVSLNSSICMAVCVYTINTTKAEVHYGL